jgi:mRNA interferase MazF
MIKRGEIYWANLNPSMGSEIDKIRPVLIVSNNINNQVAETITILPITSNVTKCYPFEVLIFPNESNLANVSIIKANQIKTIDKMRLRDKIGEINSNTQKLVDKAITIHLSISI